MTFLAVLLTASVFGFIAGAVTGSGMIGVITALVFFLPGLAVALVDGVVTGIVHDAVDYAEDRAEYRELERGPGRRETNVFNDNRQVHMHQHGNTSRVARKDRLTHEEF